MVGLGVAAVGMLCLHYNQYTAGLFLLGIGFYNL